MPMEAQTRLLRVLQQGEYTTVGGRTPIKTDVRIVAATNKDLRILISRACSARICSSASTSCRCACRRLRERAEDVPTWIAAFLPRAAPRAAAQALEPRRSIGCSATAGRAMCASWKISCAGWRR
jgi:two-component system nitrogen regulation response regulator GlnG